MSVGQGSIEHLRNLLEDPDTHEEYAHLWSDISNDWIEREDVYIKFDDRIGNLKVGYGDVRYKGRERFGPELEFGWYVEKIGEFQSSNTFLTPVFCILFSVSIIHRRQTRFVSID